MSKTKPACEAATQWIRYQGEIGKISGGKSILAPFTGQDYAAFKTFVHALELYAFSYDAGREQALLCMGHAVAAMQPKVRWIARETIPQQLDWDDRERLWPLICGDGTAEVGGAA